MFVLCLRLSAAPKIIHPFKGLGVGLFKTIPGLKVGLGTAYREHCPETILYMWLALKPAKPQAQLLKAVGDAGQGKVMLLDVHDKIAASVECEEITERQGVFRRMPVRQFNDGMAASADAFRGQR